MTTRHFLRFPEFADLDSMLDYSEAHATKAPRLHGGPLGEVRGSAEMEMVEYDDETDGEWES